MWWAKIYVGFSPGIAGFIHMGGEQGGTVIGLLVPGEYWGPAFDVSMLKIILGPSFHKFVHIYSSLHHHGSLPSSSPKSPSQTLEAIFKEEIEDTKDLVFWRSINFFDQWECRVSWLSQENQIFMSSIFLSEYRLRADSRAELALQQSLQINSSGWG